MNNKEYTKNGSLPNIAGTTEEERNANIEMVAKNYVPKPVSLDDIQLTDELLELREAIAENAHDVWAEARMKEGWTFGKERNDENKKHPDLLPYDVLSESEKEYDRIMAVNTIKLVIKSGFDIIKRQK